MKIRTKTALFQFLFQSQNTPETGQNSVRRDRNPGQARVVGMKDDQLERLLGRLIALGEKVRLVLRLAVRPRCAILRYEQESIRACFRNRHRRV